MILLGTKAVFFSHLQVAGGGIMIIFSGVIGALAVGALVNVDDLEEQYRKDNPQA